MNALTLIPGSLTLAQLRQLLAVAAG